MFEFVVSAGAAPIIKLRQFVSCAHRVEVREYFTTSAHFAR